MTSENGLKSAPHSPIFNFFPQRGTKLFSKMALDRLGEMLMMGDVDDESQLSPSPIGDGLSRRLSQE